MSATRNKFSAEFRDRAVRMVAEHRGDYPSEWAALMRSEFWVRELMESIVVLCSPSLDHRHLEFSGGRAELCSTCAKSVRLLTWR